MRAFSSRPTPLGGVSETFFRRQILAEFTDSIRADHQFRTLYVQLTELSASSLGFSFYSSLDPKDQHHLKGLRIPASNEQSEFDGLVLSLTKLLVDYINEKEISILLLKNDTEKSLSGISLLEKVLKVHDVKDYEKPISFLRGLYKLRSKGSAHRKGSDYQKLISEHQEKAGTLSSVFQSLLIEANGVLQFFIDIILEKKIVSRDS